MCAAKVLKPGLILFNGRKLSIDTLFKGKKKTQNGVNRSFLEREKKKQRCQFPPLQPVAELQRNQRGKIGRQHVKAPLAAASVHV